MAARSSATMPDMPRIQPGTFQANVTRYRNACPMSPPASVARAMRRKKPRASRTTWLAGARVRSRRQAYQDTAETMRAVADVTGSAIRIPNSHPSG